jgi:hypothetical protein
MQKAIDSKILNLEKTLKDFIQKEKSLWLTGKNLVGKVAAGIGKKFNLVKKPTVKPSAKSPAKDVEKAAPLPEIDYEYECKKATSEYLVQFEEKVKELIAEKACLLKPLENYLNEITSLRDTT